MTQPPEDRPRPTPRARPTASPRTTARPSPRPKVAGSRRDRDDAPGADAAPAAPVPPAAADAAPAAAPDAATGRRSGPPAPAAHPQFPERAPGVAGTTVAAAVLGVLCLLAAAAVGVLAWLRGQDAEHVDPSVITAAEDAVADLYAYDYKDSEGSVERKLAVLTGELRDQYETELSGGIIDTYEQVSATTRYEVLDVGLQQVNDAQDTATVVVFGSYIAQSATTGNAEAPSGSECQVTPEGAQSCVQTLRLGMIQVDGDWKISELTQLTRS
jgi:hypothetical protein